MDAKKVLEDLKRRFPNEPEYHQAVEEVITINELKQWMEELNESDITFLVSEIDKYYKLEMDML